MVLESSPEVLLEQQVSQRLAETTQAKLYEKYLYNPQSTSDYQLNRRASVHEPGID